MAFAGEATRDERVFRMVASGVALFAVVLIILLLPPVPLVVREGVTTLGLVVGGLFTGIATWRRARVLSGAHRRPWLLLALGSAVAIAGNLWVLVSGSDPATDPSTISILSIAVALLLSIAALAAFPTVRRRGADLAVMLLDGLVAGGAFLLIASVLAFTTLFDGETETTVADRVAGIAFPVLDVLLATVAVLLVVRASRADRLLLVLVAVAFLLYAMADLSYAVRTNAGTFYYGTLLDAGWIVGYLLVGVAACLPLRATTTEAGRGPATPVADALGTTLVFAVVAVATVVQVLFGGEGSLQGAQSVLWVLIVVGAGLRQVLLTADNSALRRDLERRVREQTADLARLARQNEVLVTSVGDGIYGVDAEGRVTFLNPSGAEALGHAPGALEGRRAHETFHAPDADGMPFPWTGCYVHEAITHGTVAAAEPDEYVRADGSTFPVEITAAPLLDGETTTGAVVVFRDVTQRREVERMKDEFLSVVSHELRTPLTSIRGSLGLLAGGRLGELPERATSLINVAVQSTDRLTRLINDLLDVERMQSGSRPMDTTVLDVRHLLASAGRQVEGLAASFGVRIEVGAGSGRVVGDEDRVIQTLLNLLGNAVKFSEPGAVVRAEAEPDGDAIHFRVVDHGRGIPADKLEDVFERFAQVDSSDTRQKGGTGLGLAISRSIVERHGGRIWAESELGAGTTIHFTLPAAVSLSPVEPVAAAPAPEPGARVVLVCDDDEVVVAEFGALLRAHGFDPVGVTDGAAVLALARERRPAAIVLDLVMPETTGAEVLAALRAAPDTHDIPVVIISGLSPDADAQSAREAEDWLVKPVSEERLVRAVSVAVRSSETDRTVLLIEDDEQLAEVIATLLGDEGLTVLRATSVAEAVALGERDHPGVVVLDLRLPDGDGSQVVAAFHERVALARTPLVVYSASEVETPRREDLELGTTVFMTKGRVSPQEVRDQVLALVGAVAGGPDVRTGPR